MRRMRIIIMALLLAGMTFTYCSCDQHGDLDAEVLQANQDDQNEESHPVTKDESHPIIIRLESDSYTEKLITSEELLSFVSNSEIGINEEDFTEIDIDDFIATFLFASPTMVDDARLYELERYMKRYIDYRVNANSFDQMQPLVLVSVDSTDYEFEMFIDVYFDALGMKYEKLGQAKEGFDHYWVTKAAGEHFYLYIGQTKHLSEYDIRNEGPYTLYIKEPERYNNRSLPYFIFFSKDMKFFLGLGGYGYDDTTHNIISLFTETAAPSSRDE